LDAPVVLTFARPVDRDVVQRNVHLINERAMADSLCPDSAMMPHETMMSVMADSTIMHHMDVVHSTPGRFSWNADSTECYFRPDSLMMPRTQYMIHMGTEMMQMMERRMGNMGMMDGHGSGMMRNEMVLHFVTMDTTRAGGGHGGHH
jgi:hypothetical protein